MMALGMKGNGTMAWHRVKASSSTLVGMSTMEVGTLRKRMEKGFTRMQRVRRMRENLRMINSTGKVLKLGRKVQSTMESTVWGKNMGRAITRGLMAVSMMVNGPTIRLMDWVATGGLMAGSIMATGSTMTCMVSAFTSTLTASATMATSAMTRKKVSESITGLMVASMKDNGMQANSMESGFTLIQSVNCASMVSGSTANANDGTKAMK